MKVDLVRITVAVEIAPEHDGILVGTRDWRQLRLERGALGLAAATERFGEREAVELGQILQIARLMRGKLAAQQRGERKHNSDSDAAWCPWHTILTVTLRCEVAKRPSLEGRRPGSWCDSGAVHPSRASP